MGMPATNQPWGTPLRGSMQHRRYRLAVNLGINAVSMRARRNVGAVGSAGPTANAEGCGVYVAPLANRSFRRLWFEDRQAACGKCSWMPIWALKPDDVYEAKERTSSTCRRGGAEQWSRSTYRNVFTSTFHHRSPWARISLRRQRQMYGGWLIFTRFAGSGPRQNYDCHRGGG